MYTAHVSIQHLINSRIEIEWNEMERNKAKQNKTKHNRMGRNDVNYSSATIESFASYLRHTAIVRAFGRASRHTHAQTTINCNINYVISTIAQP